MILRPRRDLDFYTTVCWDSKKASTENAFWLLLIDKYIQYVNLQTRQSFEDTAIKQKSHEFYVAYSA